MNAAAGVSRSMLGSASGHTRSRGCVWAGEAPSKDSSGQKHSPSEGLLQVFLLQRVFKSGSVLRRAEL